MCWQQGSSTIRTGQTYTTAGWAGRAACESKNPVQEGRVCEVWHRAHEETLLSWEAVMDYLYEYISTSSWYPWNINIQNQWRGRRQLKLCCCRRGTCVVVMSKKNQDSWKRILISIMNLANVIENMHKRQELFTSFVITITLFSDRLTICLL
jgi:hypothetical protein